MSPVEAGPLNIELNSCSGGMSEGFRRAGITFDLAFDWDADACASYERNLGHTPVRMDIWNLLALAKSGSFSPGPVRLLVADPPCTPWSRAGKRLGVKDERDMLGATCELIGILRPQVYMIGNVPGLQDSTQWQHVQRALAPLHAMGCCIRDYVSLDAASYGVPQRRIRPFWVGHLRGPCVRWPAPTHGPPRTQLGMLGFALKPWVTCRDALQHLPVELLGRPVHLRQAQGERDRHPPSAPSAPSRTLHVVGGRAGRREGVLFVDERPPATVSDLDGWPWDRPATTVARDPRIPPPGHHATGSYLSPPDARGSRRRHGSQQSERVGGPDRPSEPVDARAQPRAGIGSGQVNAVVLSEVAAAILQGFPEAWVFCGATKKARWSLIGQAMPPPLAEAIARAIVDQLAFT